MNAIVLDQIRWCLIFMKQDRLPDCALWGADTEENARLVASKRAEFREGIGQAVTEFVRVLNYAAEVRDGDEWIAGHPLRAWYRGVHLPQREDVAVRMDQSQGGSCLRPVVSASARFLSRNLPVPRIEVCPGERGGEQFVVGRGPLARGDGMEDFEGAAEGEDEPGAAEADSERLLAFRAFALAARLDEGKCRRAPAHVAVLRMYCCEGLSVRSIAREYGCSEGTVFNRKRDLEARLGQSLEAFRELGSWLAEAEKTANYAKAKKIHRMGLMG